MTATNSTPQSGALDAQALNRLRELDPTGANRLMERVAAAFLGSIERLIPEILQSAGTGPDLAAIRHIAHTLKSSSASIGALALSHRCAEIERLAHEGRADCLASLLDGLQSDVEPVRVALNLILAEPRPR